MNFCIALIIGIAVLATRPCVNAQQDQYCVTPENYYGTCVVLTYCPQLAQIYQTVNRQAAQQYLFALQRSCGTRSINRDPVVCCTRPTNTRPVQPVTSAPNPFFPTTTAPNNNNGFVLPTTSRNTRNPQNPRTTTTRRTTTTTTRRPTAPPQTQAPPVIDERGDTCKTPDLRDGTCVDITQCEPLVNELYAKPNDPTFANYLRASNRVCSGVGSTVCCPSSTNSPVTVTTARPPRPANTNDVPRRLLTPAEGCGFTDNSYKKIVGGEVSKKGAWPWIALLGYDDDAADSPFKCGGALVTARHVITAAHCLRNDLTFVRLGEHDLTTDTEARHVDIPVVRKEGHPEYNRKNGRSDIAVLYLARNVQFTDNIAPICMPITPELQRKSYVRYTPFVVGWGKTMERGIAADILQELQIPIFENEVCSERYARMNRNFTADQFDAAVICAGVLSGGKDTCQGDSGGPLMIPEAYGTNVRYYLIGVVSYGIGCARPEVPGVYSSVQFFMNWIEQKIADTN